MAQVAGSGTVFNLPNYAGELFTADYEQTPVLSLIGGMTGGMATDNFEFPTALLYDYPAPAQPAISETAAETAPASSVTPTSQETNVVQKHHEAVTITYDKMANSGRMSGLNTAGQQPNPQNTLDWQIQRKLIKIARDVEYSFINGQYAKAATSADANKTRGLLQLVTTNAVLNGTAADLTKAMIDNLCKLMADNGAYFNRMILLCGTKQKQVLSNIYANQVGFNLPATRNEAGTNIIRVETDFFPMDIMWSRSMPQDSILVVDAAHLAPVFQTIPGKGNFFLEPLAKTGAAEKYQLYGHIGLAHGPQFLHGKITGLK